MIIAGIRKSALYDWETWATLKMDWIGKSDDQITVGPPYWDLIGALLGPYWDLIDPPIQLATKTFKNQLILKSLQPIHLQKTTNPSRASTR